MEVQLVEKLINWLNTSYGATRGNFLITVTVTVILTMILQAFFGDLIKKIAKTSKEKNLNIIKKFSNKPFIKERIMYIKIIYNEYIKKRKNGYTKDMPPGLSLKEHMLYRRKFELGEHFAYRKLENKIQQYQNGHKELIENFRKKSPENERKVNEIEKLNDLAKELEEYK